MLLSDWKDQVAAMIQSELNKYDGVSITMPFGLLRPIHPRFSLGMGNPNQLHNQVIRICILYRSVVKEMTLYIIHCRIFINFIKKNLIVKLFLYYFDAVTAQSDIYFFSSFAGN